MENKKITCFLLSVLSLILMASCAGRDDVTAVVRVGVHEEKKALYCDVTQILEQIAHENAQQKCLEPIISSASVAGYDNKSKKNYDWMSGLALLNTEKEVVIFGKKYYLNNLEVGQVIPVEIGQVTPGISK